MAENDRFDELREAALKAEYESGAREPTEQRAQSHVVVRVARMTFGFLVLVAGIAMLPLPGPGWMVIALGLAILARDVAWADRALRYVRRRVPGVPEDGKIPRSTMITMTVVTLAAVAASLYFAFGR